MKGSLTKFQFVCFIFKFIFIKTFCRGVKQEGVKSKYDLPSDLPMDAKQHAWTAAKGAGYLVFVSSHYFKMRQLSVSQFVYFSFILREREEEKTKYSPPKEMLMAQKPNLQIAKPIGGHVSYVPCWSLDPFVSWYFYRWNCKTIFWVDLQFNLHEFTTIFLDISWPSNDTNWSLGHFSIWTFVWSLESWLPFLPQFCWYSLSIIKSGL